MAPFFLDEKMYKTVDIKKWSRYHQYTFFKSYDLPFFNICTELDVTDVVLRCKKHDYSFFISSLYASLYTANDIPEFKYRIKQQEVIEYENIHAGSTVLNEDNTFSFCYFDYCAQFKDFNNNAKHQMSLSRSGNLALEVKKEALDLIHYSSIPWISFSSFSHARKLDKDDSIPKIVFGKYHEKSGRFFMPLSVEVHHALMDGYHVGQYFSRLQEILMTSDIWNF